VGLSRGGIIQGLDHQGLDKIIAQIENIDSKIRNKLEAALYWIRQSTSLMYQWDIDECCRVYVGYWNAFECLVDAIDILQPLQHLSSAKKNKLIKDFFHSLSKDPTISDIAKCYRDIVDPGFRKKASHALMICFGAEARRYVKECFELNDEKNRLYQIRNSISHGDIEAENLEELARINERLTKLRLMVVRIIGWLINDEANRGSSTGDTAMPGPATF
jgi:hypothetical protein